MSYAAKGMAVMVCALWAQTIYSQSVTPLAITAAAPQPGGARAVIQYVARGFAANDPIYVKRAVNVGKTSVANVIKKRAFSPWGAAITIAITAAGYYLDSTTEEIYTNGLGPGTAPDINGPGWTSCSLYCTQNNSISDKENQCSNGGQVPVYTVTIGQCGFPTSDWDTVNTYTNTAEPCPASPGTWDSTAQTCGGAPIATEDDVENVVVPEIAPSAWPDLFTNPETGLPDVATVPELAEPIPDIMSDVIAETDADPATVADTDPLTGDTGSETFADSSDIGVISDARQDIPDTGTNNQSGEQTPEDYTFSANPGVFDPTVDVPQKNSLTGVFDGIQTDVDAFASTVGVSAVAGACSVAVPVDLGAGIVNSDIDFCAWQPQFSEIGTIILGFAYLTAGLMVMRV